MEIVNIIYLLFLSMGFEKISKSKCLKVSSDSSTFSINRRLKKIQYIIHDQNSF